MNSWMWMVGGIGFLVFELFAPAGFYFFLLGCSAILVGGLISLGILPSMNAQVGAFAVLAIAFPLAFRAKLKQFFPKKVDGVGNDTIGQIVVVRDAVLPGANGTGELWGSPWRIKNVDSSPLHAKDEAVVTAAEGVTLMVKRKN